MVEDARPVSSHAGENGAGEEEEKEVEIRAQIPAGENVRKPGSNVRNSDLLRAGKRIISNGGEIGTLAFGGKKEVSEVSF